MSCSTMTSALGDTCCYLDSYVVMVVTYDVLGVVVVGLSLLKAFERQT